MRFVPVGQPVSCVIIVAGYEVIGGGCTCEGLGTQVAVVIVAVSRVDGATVYITARQPVGVVVVVVGVYAGNVGVAGYYQGGLEPVAHVVVLVAIGADGLARLLALLRW